MDETDGKCVLVEQYEGELLYRLPVNLTACQLKELILFFLLSLNSMLSV